MRELFKLTLLGPNRRSDRTVIEQLFAFDANELRLVEAQLDGLHGRVDSALREVGAGLDRQLFPAGGMPTGTVACLAWLYAATAVSLQRVAGHEVSLAMFPPRADAAQACVVFEHEVAEVGEYAGELALALLAATVPGLAWRSGHLDPARPVGELYAEFSAFAGSRALPGDTAAIVRAARRRGIPCVKLEREPYQGLEGDFRIRRNSLLMLGHARHQQIVDGTLGINRSQDLLPLVRDPAALLARLADLAFPTAGAGEVAGRRFTLVVAGHEFIACAPHAELHPSTIGLAVAASQGLGAGLLSMTVTTPDPRLPLAEAGGAVVDVDPAPRLDEILGRDAPHLDAAAEGFVRWLFPEGSASRIPVIAVTGTNGKTTTSRMIAHILQSAGRGTALKCSDGSYFNGARLDLGDPRAVDPYFMQFEAPETEVAVQETHFGRIVRLGFPYLESSVAVCTNVTTDHIGRLGVESVAEMAAVKRAVLERARDGVVLNADDGHCREMLPHLRARKTCLVSLESGADALRGLAADGSCACVRESIDGRDWLVLHDGDAHPVAPVEEIPATFEGTAVCNVYNAMQAIAATHLLGVDFETMRRALGSFRMEMDMALGRFNVYRGHPFTVVLDFAHNADGIRRIGEFVAAQDVPGRRILLVAASGERSDIDIRAKGRDAAGLFDHYVVRSYPDARGKDRRQAVDEMARALIEGGVPEAAITGIPDPYEATQAILQMGNPGDWLVMTWGNGEAERMWEAITSFRSDC